MSEELPVGPENFIEDMNELEVPETAVAYVMALPELQSFFERQLLSIEQVQETAVAYAEKLLTAVQAGDVAAAQQEITHLQEALAAWQVDADGVRERAETAVVSLQDELALRPDLSLIGFQEKWRTEPGLVDESMLIEAPGIVAEIVAYDEERASTQSDLNNIVANVLKIQQSLLIWNPEEVEMVPPIQIDEEIIQNLTEVKQALAETQNVLTRLEGRHTQLRTMSMNIIQRDVRRLLELGEPESSVLVDEVTLADIQTELHMTWPDEKLVFLEKQIQSKINQYSLERKSAISARLAQSLLENWNDAVVIELLEALAEDGDDVQAALLLLAANNAHTRRANFQLSEKVVYSLLRGIGLLSQKAKPFDLLNLLSNSFLSGWKTDETAAQAELCLVFTAAYFCGRYELPSGILWQLVTDWPLENMPNWQILWHSLLLLEEPVRIVTKTGSEVDSEETLSLTRQKVQETLSMQDGRYVRAATTQSKRHSHMLGTYLLPQLVIHQKRLSGLEQRWQENKPNQRTHLIMELETWLADELEDALNEDGMVSLYEAGVKSQDIRDNNSFLRRSSLTLSINAGQDILEYARALLAVWQESQQDVSQVYQADLARELEQMSPETSLGQIALNEMIQEQGTLLISREPDIISRQSRAMLTQELTTKPAHALNTPRLVGFLAEHPFGWSELLPHLLEDIAEPVLAEEAVNLLLLAQAPWHALLLTTYIERDMQKQAQKLQHKMQKEVADLETAVLKLNGHISNELQKAKEFGRYRFVIALLELQRVALQDERSEQTKALQAKGRELRQIINNLDNELFEIQSEIPHDAYVEIEKGFQMARKAVREPANFHIASEYIEAIRYRLDHLSWPLADIHEVTERLAKKLADIEETEKLQLSASEVLDHLRNNNLRILGLDPDFVPTSQIDTRIRILEDWLVMKKTGFFLTSDMHSRDIRHIQHFFRTFLRLTALKQMVNAQGQPLEFNDPTIYQHMELKYPRTKILKERRLILITLPGNPPLSHNITLFERIVVDKEWLGAGESYAFVIVFIPNCTDEIQKRLQRNFTNQGLVVINENALVDMCLAIKANQNALGCLRPMLLNSLDIQDISIFQVNQAIHPDTSIFVGRQNLITRVANSHDNYAIFGGRRIGKTSVLLAIKKRLEAQDVFTISYSFEGMNISDESTARNLAGLLKLDDVVETVDDFKLSIQKKLDENPDLSIVLLLDEIDRYIVANPNRHKIIESMRNLSDQNGGRFRVVIAGFMEFYHCLRGRGPYSPSSDPWRRMLNHNGPLGNLRAENAEEIVREGFLNVLGWEFEHPMIPERIVLRTGGHPAFVQYFCGKIQEVVGKRNGRTVKLEDIEIVFGDVDPKKSFIAHVRNTLELNLEPIERYLIVWLAYGYNEATTFTTDEIQEVFDSISEQMPATHLYRALEQLEVTSVVIKAKAEGVYEFSVPDYPNILHRLGDTTHLNELEKELMNYLDKINSEEM